MRSPPGANLLHSEGVLGQLAPQQLPRDARRGGAYIPRGRVVEAPWVQRLVLILETPQPGQD